MSDLLGDFSRGRWDVAFFSERFLGIRLHPGQKRMARAYLKRNKTGWRALYLWLMVAAGNRAGKTLAVAVIIIHACVYKMGLKPPDESEESVNRWRKAPFMWFHFAVQQEIAELVFNEVVNILTGIHPGQITGTCPLADELGGAQNVAAFDKKFNGDYRWIVFNEMLGGAQVHFRTTGEKAIGSLGRDMHGISFDEVGFEKNLTFIVGEVLHLRRLGTGGQIILISTPSEDIGPLFADMWYTGDPDQLDRKKGRFSMRMSTRENIGYGLDQEVFDSMLADIDDQPDLIAQNIDGMFIQGRTVYFNAASINKAFVDWLPERMPARAKHHYAQGVDPAKTQDSAWSIVLDVQVNKTSAQYMAAGVYADKARGKLTTPQLVALAATPQNSYDNSRIGSHCTTAIDATGFGGKMFKEALEQEVAQVRSIEFGGSIQKKRKLLGDVRSMLDEGRLFFPRKGIWLKLRQQLLGYKIDDRSIEQDAVMALACAVAEVSRSSVGAADPSARWEYNDTAEDALPVGDGRRWSRTPYQHTPREVS